MKTNWFAMAMLTLLMILSASVVQVEAATLDLSNTAEMDDGDNIAEAFPSAPSALSDDGCDTEDTEASE